MPGERFSILFVCTGNICRSAFAERVLAARVDPVSAIDIASAGTRAVVGRPMSSQTRPRVRLFGGDPDGFTATQLTERALHSSDLVLGMTREHCERVADLLPSAFARTFSLLEFARAAEGIVLDGGVPPERRWHALRDAAIERRRRGELAIGPGDDVPDPYGHADDAFDRMTETIVPALELLVASAAALGEGAR